MLRNRIFRLRKVHIRVVPSCKVVDLLIDRNGVFRLRNSEMAVPF